MENITDPRMMEQIAKESGAKIGGSLFSDALSDENGPAASYIDMMRNNIRQLSSALTS
jgi:zinc/manganese transport system substrate-binding protein